MALGKRVYMSADFGVELSLSKATEFWDWAKANLVITPSIVEPSVVPTSTGSYVSLPFDEGHFILRTTGATLHIDAEFFYIQDIQPIAIALRLLGAGGIMQTVEDEVMFPDSP